MEPEYLRSITPPDSTSTSAIQSSRSIVSPVTMLASSSPPNTSTPSRPKSALGFRNLVDRFKQRTPSVVLQRAASTSIAPSRRENTPQLRSRWLPPASTPQTQSDARKRSQISHIPIMVSMKSSPGTATTATKRPTLPPEWVNTDSALRQVEEQWRREAQGLTRTAARDCLLRAECIAITDPLVDLTRKLPYSMWLSDELTCSRNAEAMPEQRRGANCTYANSGPRQDPNPDLPLPCRAS